jgi:hypothetical protein
MRGGKCWTLHGDVMCCALMGCAALSFAGLRLASLHPVLCLVVCYATPWWPAAAASVRSSVGGRPTTLQSSGSSHPQTSRAVWALSIKQLFSCNHPFTCCPAAAWSRVRHSTSVCPADCVQHARQRQDEGLTGLPLMLPNLAEVPLPGRVHCGSRGKIQTSQIPVNPHLMYIWCSIFVFICALL